MNRNLYNLEVLGINCSRQVKDHSLYNAYPWVIDHSKKEEHICQVRKYNKLYIHNFLDILYSNLY